MTSIIKRQYAQKELRDFGRIPPDSIGRALADFKDEPGKERLKMITGHVPYGIHQFIGQESRYFTILRQPVARVISFYRFIISEPGHFQHRDLLARKVKLEQFVNEQAARGLNDFQTRFLIAGDLRPNFWENLAGPLIPLPANALEMAKENISQRFDAVGTSERFDESLLLIAEVLGWKNPFYLRENIGKMNKGKTRPDEVPAATMRLIERLNQNDLALFDFVNSRLDQVLAEKGEVFQKQVENFRRRNQHYAPLRRMVRAVRAMASN